MTTHNSALFRTPLSATQVHGQVSDLLQSSADWLQTNWLRILVAAAIGALVVLALFWVRGLGTRLVGRSASGKGWPAVFGRAIALTNSFFIVTLSARLVTGFAGAPADVATTIGFLFTIAAVFQVAVWAREIILGAIVHRTHSEHYSGEALGTAIGLIRVLVTFVVFAVAFVVVLDNLGVNVTGLIAGLGVGGIAIGLAAQGIFADLFAALAIIFDRPFHRGDTIAYDTTIGTVESIGLKSTRIRAATGEERIIANKNLLDKEIQNISRREYRRIRFTLALVQWTPIETMERFPAMLKEIVEEVGVKFVRAGFEKFGDSSYDFDLEFDSRDAGFKQFFDARHAVGVAIIRRLNDEGIELAYPTQTAFTAAPDGGLILPYPEAQPRDIKPSDRAATLTPDQASLGSRDEAEG